MQQFLKIIINSWTIFKTVVSGSEVRISFFPGAGFDIEKIMDPDPVCIERLDPDPVYPESLDPVTITPDPQPCSLPSSFLYI